MFDLISPFVFLALGAILVFLASLGVAAYFVTTPRKQQNRYQQIRRRHLTLVHSRKGVKKP